MKIQTVRKTTEDLYIQLPDGTLQLLNAPENSSLVKVSLTDEQQAALDFFKENHSLDANVLVTSEGLTMSKGVFCFLKGPIHDEDLNELVAHLKQIVNLRCVALNGSLITDPSPLAALSGLSEVILSRSKMRDAEKKYNALKEKMPNTEITI